MTKRLKGRLYVFCLAAGLGIGAAAFPATVAAQLTTNGNASNGNAPAFNKAVQGESAGTVEGTVENAMNWLGNVICPLLAVGAGVHTVMQLRSGGRWLPSAATGVGLLSISGIIRLAEYFIVNTSSTGISQ
jgi:predicted transporter